MKWTQSALEIYNTTKRRENIEKLKRRFRQVHVTRGTRLTGRRVGMWGSKSTTENFPGREGEWVEKLNLVISGGF